MTSAKRPGRPPKFKSVAEMQQKIDDYFEDCEGKPLLDDDDGPMLNKYGEVIYVGRHPPTVTGLALALGFHSRQSLLDYQGKKEFLDTITRAKMRIEAYAEERLYDRDGQRGAEFSLKYNFRWAQENQSEQETGGGVIVLPARTDGPREEGAEDGDT